MAFAWFHLHLGWGVGHSLIAALVEVAAFRGIIDVLVRRFIPWPSLFGTDDPTLRREDMMNRRRAWFWSHKLRLLRGVAILITVVFVGQLVFGHTSVFPLTNWWHAGGDAWHWTRDFVRNPNVQGYVYVMPILFLINFVILFGPMLAMGISQIRSLSPATPTGACVSSTCVDRPRRKRRCAGSSRCGSRERRSRQPVGSGSAACSSSARPGRARRSREGDRHPNKLNPLLDALYVVPAKIGKVPLRLPPPHPRREQIYFIGATNAPLRVLDPALVRPGRMGRHVWVRTPTKQDRLDIFELYIDRVAHVPELDTPKRRDEIARVTHGYSPAMIEQVCSTYAHHEGRDRFEWRDLIEAMTTVESGTAEAIEYAAHETRSVAIHEAGHAVCGHIFMAERFESTRLSVRKRGTALGHHVAAEREERFTTWQHEEMGTLAWTLGSMAAEHVFYGENANGVFGDV